MRIYLLLIYSLCFAIVIGVEQYTNFDLWIQHGFFDKTTQLWSITKEEHKGVLGLLLYRGYKNILIITGVVALLLWIYYTVVGKEKGLRIALIEYILSLICIPLIVSILKPITNIYCPSQLSIFNGFAPYIRIIDSYPEWFSNPHGRCFPAGHATSGFFFCILYYALQNTKYASYRWYGMYFGLIMGWIMGIYQMARGEHFISHTLATMIIALISVLLIDSLVRYCYKEKALNT